ncbi:hypothetical protein STEG23_000324, partial [Scotinomys teguina]
WFPFSGITELVNNVLQPQQKLQNEKEPQTKLHQQFEMYKEQVKKMGEESQQQPEQKGDAPTCGICHKTKFADGCGHNCSYCQTKFCARCGGRVSLRSNKAHFTRSLCPTQQRRSSLSPSKPAVLWLILLPQSEIFPRLHSKILTYLMNSSKQYLQLSRTVDNCFNFTLPFSDTVE